MFILSSISSSLEFWSVNHNAIYKKSGLKIFKNIKILGEISSGWTSDLFWPNVCKTLNLIDNHC